MKRLIEKFMAQAGTDTSGKWMSVDHAEQFAELIVRECVKVCSGVEEDGELSPELGTFADGALLCREEIKAHFGVEP